jgi:hypothetical protein
VPKKNRSRRGSSCPGVVAWRTCASVPAAFYRLMLPPRLLRSPWGEGLRHGSSMPRAPDHCCDGFVI